MAQLVKFGREWEINTKEDYDNAMEILAQNDFCAEMSDDFSVWQKEKEEVRRQRAVVKARAQEKGII